MPDPGLTRRPAVPALAVLAIVAVAVLVWSAVAIGPLATDRISSPRESPLASGMRPTLGAPASIDCTTRLQQLVQAAAPGSTLDVPACIYRETVVVDRPLTLRGHPGTEVRGSDIWTAWKAQGGYWEQGPVPDLQSSGQCRPGTERCHWPEQVFVDGAPLVQVGRDPDPGQFAVDAERRVILGVDPRGHLVEVTTRTRWVVVKADGVTIEGFTFRHAANPAQQGAIGNDGYDRLVVRSSELSDAHGALISFQGGSGHALLGSDLTRGGQLGVHLGGSGADDVTISGNRIHGNNTEDYDPGWEAGGLKASGGRRLTIVGNEVYDNAGPGIWCDIGCSDVDISANRVYRNEHAGISYEISSGGRITDNQIWENGHGRPDWVGGGGIVCNVCRATEIAGNVLAWNADGIGVQSQARDRPEWKVVDVWVHDNVIAATDADGDNQRFALGWVQDFAGPLLDPASNNRGSGNSYWYATPEGRSIRFEWGTPLRDLSAFNATPGEEGGRYLTAAEKDAILSGANMPLMPVAR